MGVMDK